MVDYGCFYFGKVSHNLVSKNPTHWDRKCNLGFTVPWDRKWKSRVFTGSALIRSDVIRLATGLVTADL